MIPVQEMLRRSALAAPGNEAVVAGDVRIPFRELDECATRIARLLRSRGIGKGDRVGIFTSKSVEEVMVLFGILRAGAAFVHINPQFRQAHLRHVVQDCGLRVLFLEGARGSLVADAFSDETPFEFVVNISEKHLPPSPALPNPAFLHELLRGDTPGEAPTNDETSDDDLASIIYTSGSTGMPKGIMVTHRILSDATTISAEVLGNRASDRIISVTPFTFDGALSQLFTAVLAGGTLVQQKSNFPKDIVDTLRRERISGFHTVPSLWGVLLQERSVFPEHEYPDLRYVSIIGEVLPPRHLARLREVLKSTRFFLMYGTTEAFRSTYLPPEDLDRKQGSVGVPFPGVSIEILDEEGRRCPPGEVGQIVHRGVFISPGYWKDPERNRRTFVKGAVMTGDRGWLDAEGYLYFAGRRDGMIKVLGYRVSPDEVENCIYEMDAASEVAVLGVPAPEVGTVVKAFVVPQPDAELTPEGVISHCRRRLPHYMVPAEVEIRRSLPKTSGNKIDRTALKSGAG